MHCYHHFFKPNWLKGFCILFCALVFTTHTSTESLAQIQLQLGGDEAQLKAMLTRRGYNRIETKQMKVLESEFYGCKDGIRYIIDVKWNGSIKETRVGKCRIQRSKEAIAAELKRQGYERISFEDRGGKFLVIACKGNVRSRLEVNNFGDIVRKRRIGRCEKILSPTDITVQLEEKGYNRIKFIDRQLPIYVADVCEGRKKLRLEINSFGEIKGSENIGSCRRPIRVENLVSVLEEKGYKNVVVTRDRLPRYQAIACRGDNKVEVTVNRYGQIIDEYRTGRCERAFTIEELETAMRDQGYKRINIKRDGRDTFIAMGCLDGRLNEIKLTKFGKLISRKERGGCDSPKMHKLADILRGRGMRELEFSVTACQRGRKKQIIFDEYANRISEKELGGCK